MLIFRALVIATGIVSVAVIGIDAIIDRINIISITEVIATLS